MPRFIRIQTYVVAGLSVLELDDGEGIIAASSDGQRVAVVTAKDVSLARQPHAQPLRPVDGG